MAKHKPAHEIRLGRIRAAIWANDTGHDGPSFSVTMSRLYKDGEVWKDSSSLYRDDLPVAAKILDMAYAWIWNRQDRELPSQKPV